MKRLVLLPVIMVIIIGLILTGCSQSTPAPAPTQTKAPAQTATPAQPAANVPSRLVWATFQEPSTEYTTSLGLTDMMNKYVGISVNMRPYPNPAIRGIALMNNEADFSVESVYTSYDRARGVDKGLNPTVKEAFPKLRMIMGADVMWFAWIVLPSSGVTTLEGLKGKSVSYETAGIELNTTVGRESLKAAGLDLAKDVKIFGFGARGEKVAALKDKKVDAGFTSMGGSDMAELNSTTGFVILPNTPEQFKKFSPMVTEWALIQKQLEAGHVLGIKQPTWMLGVPKIIICREEFNEEAAYRIVKTFMERGRELDVVAPQFKEIGVKEYALPEKLAIPLHPGAIRYFKEVGMWTAAYESMQQALLTELSKVK